LAGVPADKIKVDRRLRERLRLNLAAQLNDLSGDGGSEHGRLIDVSDAGVCLTLAAPLVAGTMVRVDFCEGSLFGQIMHVTPEGDSFRAGIEVFDVLLGNSDLSRLIQHTLQAPHPHSAARTIQTF
jgi:PilZ domain